jgi:endonuclease/exonuclease/phosphatase family metal-dependent hydrolase
VDGLERVYRDMPAIEPKPHECIRVLSYNVHRCLGLDGILSPSRIAEVIAGVEPDIVALQELDVGRLRSGNVDQAQLIADELKMNVHFHPAMRVLEELYGDAVLTDRPVRLVKAGALPVRRRSLFSEPRGAIWVSVDCSGTELQLVNTHLALDGRERLQQIDMLLGPSWTAHPDCRDPLLLVGDLNAVPISRSYRRLAASMRGVPGPPAFPSNLPFLRLDHVFCRGDIAVVACHAVKTRLSRIASDHLPIIIDIQLTVAQAIAPANMSAVGAFPPG